MGSAGTGGSPGSVIQLPRECIDVLTWRGIQDRIEEAIAAGHRRIIIVGAGVVKFSSLGLGTLIAYANRMKNLGGTLVLTAFSKQAKRPFEICRIEHSFLWEDTEPAKQ
jgi:anti-anti-sigma factor